METPSSMRTRSEAILSSQKKIQHEDASVDKGRAAATAASTKPERSALIDITNDSPIVGLAAGNLKTPSSSLGKKCKGPVSRRTPGSGEALLRGQVKNLLQRVEEESELVKLSSSADKTVAPFRVLLGHLRSPGGLLAPTPNNTPQIAGLPSEECIIHAVIPPLPEGSGLPPVPAPEEHLVECQLNRALLFDSPEKSETIASSSSVSSALTYQGTARSFAAKSTEDDCSSEWSLRAIAGSHKEDDEEDEMEDSYYEEDEVVEDFDDGGILGDLCEGLSRMTVVEKRGLPELAGKHTRFVYNSDDEIGEEEVEENHVVHSPNVLLLKGLPVPEGKHLRFQEEDEAKHS